MNCRPRPLYPRYPLSRRLGGAQGRSGRFGKEKTSWPSPEVRKGSSPLHFFSTGGQLIPFENQTELFASIDWDLWCYQDWFSELPQYPSLRTVLYQLRSSNTLVVMILGNCPTWRTNSFQCIYLFIVLYMFRACHAHHQEKQIVSIQLLVIVTPCWWHCRGLVGSKLPTSTRHDMLETCRELQINKYIEKNCASSWTVTKNHCMMHGKQNVKLNISVS